MTPRKGKEPVSSNVNFVDLTQCEDGNDVNGATSSAAPVAPMAPTVVNPNDAGTSRTTLDYLQQQPPPPPVHQQSHVQEEPRPLLRGQGDALRHPELSSTMNIFNRGHHAGRILRNGCPTLGVSGDHCRQEQQGGLSESQRRRRQLQGRPIQPATSGDNSLTMLNEAMQQLQATPRPWNQQRAMQIEQHFQNREQAIVQHLRRRHEQAILQLENPEDRQQAILEQRRHERWFASFLGIQAEIRMHNRQRARDAAMLDDMIMRRYISGAKAHFDTEGRRRGQ